MISIIIPAYNEEGYIEDTLKSIKEQDYKDYELIVVCNGCTDNTKEIARKYTNRLISLKERNTGLARNSGAEIAKGNKLVFLDADTRINKDTLKTISEINSLGTCKVIPDSNSRKAIIAYKLKSLLNPFGLSNGIIFCDKELFKKVNGFPLKGRGEDGVFIRAAMKHSRFKIANTYVINSTRRFEKWGYLRVPLFWFKEYLFPTKKEYEAIR